MKRAWIIALAAMVCCPVAVSVHASIEEELASVTQSRPARSHMLGATADAAGDTLYVGYTPGHVGPDNYWSIWSGRGPGFHRPPAQGGMWDWETPVHGDSLQGWWPRRLGFNNTGGQTRKDWNRAWWAIDIGNQANYVMNQGAGNQRTFGVVGIWHRDPGSAGGGGVAWAPLGGTYSAWMGLRRHGDNSVIDPITANPFNENVLAFNGFSPLSPGGNDKGFPGYGNQMDQMLYRDIDLSSSPAADLTISFRYRTNMSTGFGNVAASRTGWFDKDPLQVPGGGAANAAIGNFISSSDAGDAAPRDSFMVYVGAPVIDSACVYSNATTARVRDPQRRWFSEVLRANEGLHREILTRAGDQAATLTSVVIPNATLQPLLAASGGRVRLVFRVKTNRGFDDEGSSYSSGGAGAAVVDDVTYTFGASSSPAGWGDFEAPPSIDNAIAVDASAAWKSTGKPPAVYFHPHSLGTLTYQDVCGQPGDETRTCNMTGTVISMGDHDTGEADAGPLEGGTERNRFDGMASPTIQLCGPYPNPIGLQSAAEAAATQDYYIDYEIYTGFFDWPTTGNSWWVGVQCYPGNAKAMSGGYPAWGQIQYINPIRFNGAIECYRDFAGNGLRAAGAFKTSNASGVPDSIRLMFLKRAGCFQFNLGVSCGSTDGGYLDNFSLAIVDRPTIGLSSFDDLFQDTFPANGDPTLPGVASSFDTTTAHIKNGTNVYPQTLPRFDIPGQYAVMSATGSAARVDLVFRILPGPGNYVVVGHPEADDRLRKVPTNADPASTTDLTNFWGSYLDDNGPHGTSGGHPTVGGIKRWDPNVWNSARCDTLASGAGSPYSNGVTGLWMTAYHEDDPRGVPSRLGTGAKILPDGMFTPGTHVEYFFRIESSGVPTELLPDTNRVYPQPTEGSEDAHRWQEFSVLPDRWKDPAYVHPVRRMAGLGNACMLVVDMNDREGDERAWVAAADSSGATRTYAYGAHNGWHARGDQDVNDPAVFVAKHGGHPGTIWDFYQVQATSNSSSFIQPSGSLGSRYAPAPTGPWIGKESRQGPTHEMMEAYYKTLVLLAGSQRYQALGPPTSGFANPADDLGLITTWLESGSPTSPDRAIWTIGSGFVEANSDASTPQEAFLHDHLGVDLAAPNYFEASSSFEGTPDLIVGSPVDPGGAVYGVVNRCLYGSDVLVRDPGLAAMTSVAATYEDPGGGPYIASVNKQHHPTKPWISLVDGWSLTDIRALDGSSAARGTYVMSALTNLFSVVCPFTGTPPGEVPGHDGAYRDFARIFNNPVRNGSARIQFGLARADRVEVRVYDLAGRVIRTLADRQMPAGVHDLVWDGLDDDGGRVAHGVYFTRVRYRSNGFESARKVTLLR